ncbi:prepilin-type N-terminal cleavage/methylation domain-containing protein [Fundidesulfovibrio agrisoli]|uniref:prepilin-type N-terminal cleavage/methylation domain-containing protein n=1 Tax=Fundidesulfovibrio agrisoli TaxID=2922717 RepID=UPI001FACA299
MTRRCAQAGFTLVEVMIALLITGMIFMGSYAVLSRVTDTAADVEERLQLSQQLRISAWLFKNDLGSVLYSDSNRNAATTFLSFVGGRNRPKDMDTPSDEDVVMAFASASSLDFRDSFPSMAIVRVEYVLRDDPEHTGEYTLCRREWPYAEMPWRAGKDRPVTDVEIVRRVTDPAIMFFSSTGEATATWENRSRMLSGEWQIPVQVRLTGQVHGKENRVFPLELVANLPVRAIPPGPLGGQK